MFFLEFGNDGKHFETLSDALVAACKVGDGVKSKGFSLNYKGVIIAESKDLSAIMGMLS